MTSGDRAARESDRRTHVASHGRSRLRASAFIFPEAGLPERHENAVLYDYLSVARSGREPPNPNLVGLRIGLLYPHNFDDQIIEFPPQRRIGVADNKFYH